MYEREIQLREFVHRPWDYPDAANPGFAPFGIRNINGKLYVTFAVQNAERHDERQGPGSGFIDVFDLNGSFLERFATGGALNSPWGLALAPDNFGKFFRDLLVAISATVASLASNSRATLSTVSFAVVRAIQSPLTAFGD